MLEGLPPNGTHFMRLACDAGRARSLADAISETFDSGDTAAAAFQRDPTAADSADNDWIVEVYFRISPDEAMIRELIARYCGQPAEAIRFGRIAERDWVEAALADMAPVQAGRFLICASQDYRKKRVNNLILNIPAALAFGTGHHGTTLGCLLSLEAICKTRRPQRILDIGTGTGILALAAAKLLRRPVVCSDIDPTAVRTAADNARRNGATGFVRPILANGVGHPLLRSGAPYDLIFANILARPLRLLAPALCRLASHSAILILSGLLPRDVPCILSAYRGHGFALSQRRDIDGWTTLLMRRGGAAARPLNRFAPTPSAGDQNGR